jgi:hypothetical protein
METQVNKQCSFMDGLGRENVETIQSAVSQVNSFVKMFLRAAEFNKKIKNFSSFDWQLMNPRGSICKHITAQRAMWPPI